MLFVDMEGSTRLAASLGEEWPEVLSAYHAVVSGTARAEGGWVDGSAGDGFFITFGMVAQAGRAAVAIQRALRATVWPASAGQLRARMGLHVGSVERHGHGYVGLEIHRAARVGAAAHGGQLLMTGAAAELLREVVPSQPLGAHRLKDFPAPTALYCAVIDGQGAASFPPPRTLELRRGNVPAAPIGLIGRERDLARVRAALLSGQERLVTLLGRGGVGKTSLALVAANDLLEEYPGGVWWIDAAHEHSSPGLLEAIARDCRIDATGSVHEAVIAHLGSNGAPLLVLDNLEQVAGAGRLLSTLLAQLPDLTVLATSQLPLRCPNERQLQLDRLDEVDALALLARTAERLDIPLADDHAAAELVGLLDGLPLAIELAAGRLRMFTLPELVGRLRQSMAILQDRARPDRHRSLTAALEWTLELLDPDALELFTRLGVFAGPVELQDIEEVLGADGLDVIAAIADLLDTALLQRVEIGDGFVRFGFPEAVRQEASRRLDTRGVGAWRAAHAAWQHQQVWPLRLYEIVEPSRVERAHGMAAETRAALAWAWENDRQLGRELALGRFPLAYRAGAIQEARELIDRVMADPGSDPRVVDLVRGHDLWAGADRTETSPERLIALFAELQDLYARYNCAINIGGTLAWEGRFDEALVWLDGARTLGREIGPRAEAGVLFRIADTLLDAGRPDPAAAAVAEADVLTGSQPFADGSLVSEVVRATLASVAGDHAEALDRHAQVLTHAQIHGNDTALWGSTMSLVRALARAGREPAMLEAAGVAQALAAERSAQGDLVPALFTDPEPAVHTVLARLGPPGQALIDAGRTLAPDQRVSRLCALIYTD